MPGKTAAVEGVSGISERQMQAVAHQIIDQDRMTRNAQSFTHELNDLLRLQVMNEQRAAYHVESIIAEGQGQSVTAYARIIAIEVSRGAVEQYRPDLQAIFRERLASQGSYVSGSSRHIEPGDGVDLLPRGHRPNQLLHHMYAAEPAVNHAQVGKRG